MSRARMLAASLAALALCASAQPALGMSRHAAEKRALKIFKPQALQGRVIVFGLGKPLKAGGDIGESDPLAVPLAPSAIAKGKLRAPRFGGQKAVPPVTLRRSAWVFWEDLYHGAAFEHPSRLLLLDKRTGHKIADQRLSWWPAVNGRDLPFADDDANGRILYSTLPPGSRATPAAAPAGSSFRAVAPVGLAAAGQTLGRPNDCFFIIGDRTRKDHSKRLFGNSMAAMAQLATDTGLGYANASTAADLQKQVDAAVNKKNCKDVMIFLAGHGSPPQGLPDPRDPSTPMTGTELPTVSLGAVKIDPAQPPINARVTSQDLKNIMTWAPNDVKFKIIIFSCFSGRFVETLQNDPHIQGGGMVAASSSASEFSWTYIPSGVPGADGFTKTDGAIKNPIAPDPRRLPGYVKGLITEIQRNVDDGDASNLAGTVDDAHKSSKQEDFSQTLGWTNPVDFYEPGGQGAPDTTGEVITNGSSLTPTAEDVLQSQQDEDVWSQVVAYCTTHPDDPLCQRHPGTGSRQAGSENTSMPANGQILAIRVKGMAVPSGQAGDPGPLNEIHFSDLRPQPDGSVKVIVTSGAFRLPTTGDPNQISTFNPENLCVETGDFLALSTEGGFDSTYYPGGVPFRILGKVAGSSIAYFSQHGGVMNGAQFSGQARSDTELLMQWDLATGNKATALCKGGTKN